MRTGRTSRRSRASRSRGRDGRAGRGGDAHDFRPRLQPMRQRQRLPFGLPQPQLHRAQAAQREKDVLRARRDGVEVDIGVQPRPPSALAETRPSSRSEWPERYLVPASMARSTPCSCGGKNSGVAQVLSMMTQMSRSCAASAIAGMSCISSDLRARRLGEDGARVVADQRGDAGADRRIVVGRLDAERPQHASRRSGAPANRRSRSSTGGRRRLHGRLQRHGDRRETGRRQPVPAAPASSLQALASASVVGVPCVP